VSYLPLDVDFLERLGCGCIKHQTSLACEQSYLIVLLQQEVLGIIID
jgi:hypothetical protein